MKLSFFALSLLITCAGAADRPVRSLTLREAQLAALAQNLELQIQSCNPEIARLSLRAAYGIYDPVFSAETRRENLADSGGYDPADFSKDAIYEAESHTARLGLTGVTPLGTTYTLGGDYANSFGQRNYVFFDSYNINLDLGISQPLLRNAWIDQGRMLIKLNRHQLRISELSLAYAAMSVLSQVRQAYFELAFARENQAVYRDLQDTRERFLGAVARQVQGGLLTAPDESLARSQLAEAMTRFAEARLAVDLAENALRLALGDPFTNQAACALAPADPLLVIAEVLDFEQSRRSALQHRPDLAWLRVEAEKAEVDLRYRFNQLFPSLDLVAGWGRKGAHTRQDYAAAPSASSGAAFEELYRGDSPNNMVGLVFSLPLSRTAERANYRLSKQRREQARLFIRQKEELVGREVADALAAAAAGLRRANTTREGVLHAQAVLLAEEKKLAGGKSTVLFVLQFQAALAAARSAELRARADYNQACARLRFAEGLLLDQSGFTLPHKP